MLTEISKKPGEFLVHCESLEFCTKTVTVRNGTGTARTLTDVVAYPLKAGTNGADYNLAVAGDEANITAMLLAGPPGPLNDAIGANTTSSLKYTALVHPPAILNQDAIPLLDIAGASFTQATIRTRLAALLYELRSTPIKKTIL